MAQVRAHGAARIEVAHAPITRAPAFARARERSADFLRERFDQLRDDLAHELARERQHLVVHQVLGEEDGAEQRLARLDPGEHVLVGHDLVDRELLDGIALETFDRLLGEQPMDVIDPLRDGQLTLSEVARADVSIRERGVTLVEPVERGVAREIIGRRAARAVESIGARLAEDEPPAQQVAHETSDSRP